MNIFISLVILCIFIVVIMSFRASKDSIQTTLKSNTIPEKYIDFPVYNGTLLQKPIETLSPKYERLTLFYKGKPDENYRDTLYIHGFQQATDVRYEKNNTYVIFEKIGAKTKIAYHIKK